MFLHPPLRWYQATSVDIRSISATSCRAHRVREALSNCAALGIFSALGYPLPRDIGKTGSRINMAQCSNSSSRNLIAGYFAIGVVTLWHQ